MPPPPPPRRATRLASATADPEVNVTQGNGPIILPEGTIPSGRIPAQHPASRPDDRDDNLRDWDGMDGDGPDIDDTQVVEGMDLDAAQPHDIHARQRHPERGESEFVRDESRQIYPWMRDPSKLMARESGELDRDIELPGYDEDESVRTDGTPGKPAPAWVGVAIAGSMMILLVIAPLSIWSLWNLPSAQGPVSSSNLASAQAVQQRFQPIALAPTGTTPPVASASDTLRDAEIGESRLPYLMDTGGGVVVVAKPPEAAPAAATAAAATAIQGSTDVLCATERGEADQQRCAIAAQTRKIEALRAEQETTRIELGALRQMISDLQARSRLAPVPAAGVTTTTPEALSAPTR